MINSVRTGYTNPLTMMKKNEQTNSLNSEMRRNQETKSEVKEEKKSRGLEVKKQALRDTLLLTKGTSGDGGVSEERIEFLEKKLAEVTEEVKKATSRREIECWRQRYF